MSALREFYALRRMAETDPATRPLWFRIWFRLRRERFERSVSKRYGCYLSVQTKIGKGLTLPHDLYGIFIATRAVIGNRVTIMHNVTIGSNKWPGRKGEAPDIGDDVFIGAGANIIGRCVIGDHVKIGAGVTLVNATIPHGAIIVNKSAYDMTNARFIYQQDNNGLRPTPQVGPAASDYGDVQAGAASVEAISDLR